MAIDRSYSFFAFLTKRFASFLASSYFFLFCGFPHFFLVYFSLPFFSCFVLVAGLRSFAIMTFDRIFIDGMFLMLEALSRIYLRVFLLLKTSFSGLVFVDGLPSLNIILISGS
jgi:hypothetical protein